MKQSVHIIVDVRISGVSRRRGSTVVSSQDGATLPCSLNFCFVYPMVEYTLGLHILVGVVLPKPECTSIDLRTIRTPEMWPPHYSVKQTLYMAPTVSLPIQTHPYSGRFANKFVCWLNEAPLVQNPLHFLLIA